MLNPEKLVSLKDNIVAGAVGIQHLHRAPAYTLRKKQIPQKTPFLNREQKKETLCKKQER